MGQHPLHLPLCKRSAVGLLLKDLYDALSALGFKIYTPRCRLAISHITKIGFMRRGRHREIERPPWWLPQHAHLPGKEPPHNPCWTKPGPGYLEFKAGLRFNPGQNRGGQSDERRLQPGRSASKYEIVPTAVWLFHLFSASCQMPPACLPPVVKVRN